MGISSLFYAPDSFIERVNELQAIIGKSPDITVPKGYYIVRDWSVYPKLLAMLTATLGAADAGAILPRSSLPSLGTHRSGPTPHKPPEFLGGS
jgi:hypothetical protein